MGSAHAAPLPRIEIGDMVGLARDVGQHGGGAVDGQVFEDGGVFACHVAAERKLIEIRALDADLDLAVPWSSSIFRA